MRAGDAIESDQIGPDGAYPVYGGNGVRGYATEFSHDGQFVLIGRQGALCGNVHQVSGQFWASEHAIVATPQDDVDTRWLAYVMTAMDLGQYSMSAAQPGIGVSTIGALGTPRPSWVVQRQIADFLDAETTQIDRLIAKQTGLIDTLRERRAAVVDEVVTAGLDPTVPTVHSGTSWIGRIPAHWTVLPLWSMFERIKDIGHPSEQMLSVFREFGVVPKDSRDNINRTAEDRNIYQLVHPGWLVTNRMKAWQGLGISPLGGRGL
jgi:type I restriction enzyme S subunit